MRLSCSAFTRWSFEIPLAGRVPEILRNAILISTNPPGGPAYLLIPDNVGHTVAKADIFSRELFTVPLRTKPDPRQVEKAAQLLLEAKKPFMLVGHEVWRADEKPIVGTTKKTMPTMPAAWVCRKALNPARI